MSKEGIQGILDAINKKCGIGSIMNTEDSLDDVEKISSGCLSLDLALGGGYPKGRIIEIYGPESSGKTTLLIYAMIEAQKEGKSVALIDAEHTFSLHYAKGLGLITSDNKFLISQPDNGEQAFEIAEQLIKSGLFAMVCIDSVAALAPKAEIQGDFGDAKMGLHARLMSQAMRKLRGVINTSNTILYFTNQLRDKIGVMFGNPETTTGGNSLKFYASQRLDIRRIGQNKDGETVLSNKIRVKVVKNKVAPPFMKAEFEIGFGSGINELLDILDVSIDLGIIKQAGSWYSYEDVKLGQGKNAVMETLKDNPEVVDEIKQKIRDNA